MSDLNSPPSAATSSQNSSNPIPFGAEDDDLQCVATEKENGVIISCEQGHMEGEEVCWQHKQEWMELGIVSKPHWFQEMKEGKKLKKTRMPHIIKKK